TLPEVPRSKKARQQRVAGFEFALQKDKLRQVFKREGRYVLRTNLKEGDPAKVWEFYLQLVEVEEAFKNLKGDLCIRPIFHQLESAAAIPVEDHGESRVGKCLQTFANPSLSFRHLRDQTPSSSESRVSGGSNLAKDAAGTISLALRPPTASLKMFGDMSAQ